MQPALSRVYSDRRFVIWSDQHDDSLKNPIGRSRPQWEDEKRPAGETLYFILRFSDAFGCIRRPSRSARARFSLIR